jgi:hypothetical protein
MGVCARIYFPGRLKLIRVISQRLHKIERQTHSPPAPGAAYRPTAFSNRRSVLVGSETSLHSASKTIVSRFFSS